MQSLSHKNHGLKKVLLGMSGGTDSSVSAMLLRDAGYEVVGVTFRFYETGGNRDDLNDAVSLASQLGIRHIVYDARELFSETVIRYFTDEYMNGRTPVPCVLCNNRLKWMLLCRIADENGIGHISSGHYANIDFFDGHYYIACGSDPDKDQSFFLWGLKQEVLKRIIFPLGSHTKQQVRAFAAEKGFEKVSRKKDSIGVCFCPGDYRSFLRNRVPEGRIIPGFFEDENGKIIGRHQGYPFYTVGQRRGLGINLQKPVFVKEIRPETNRIILADLKSSEKTKMILKEYHLINPDDFIDPVICKIRYRKQATLARVENIGEEYLNVTFLDPVTSVAPGQSAVFYRDNRVLGGGIIC